VLDTKGQVRHPVTGTPQGGIVSPILAPGFLLDVRDVWSAKVVNRHGRGEAWLIRYADECGSACEDHAEAERFYPVRGQWLEPFGLERSGAKTRIISYRRHRLAGNTSVEVLGVELQGGKDRKGQDHLKRRTACKKRRPSWTRCTAWGTEHRPPPVASALHVAKRHTARV
jgi:RNA-directed DNA polymerase